MSGTILTQLGIMSGLGLVMLNKRYKISKDDWKQVAILSVAMAEFVFFTIFTSMKVLDRDFKYQEYNTWEAGYTYLWRLLPPVYILADYYQKNMQ